MAHSPKKQYRSRKASLTHQAVLELITILAILLIITLYAWSNYNSGSSPFSKASESYKSLDQCFDDPLSPNYRCNALFGVGQNEVTASCVCHYGSPLARSSLKLDNLIAFNFCPSREVRTAQAEAAARCNQNCGAADLKNLLEAELYNLSVNRTSIAC